MAEDLIQTRRPRQNYVMSNNDNDGKLADTIYIICWGVDEPTPGLAKFDWKVVAHWATKYSNLVARQ